MTDTIVYVKTKNDVNGNPRRGWIVPSSYFQTDGNLFVDEGYEGRWALYRALGMDWRDYTDEQKRFAFDDQANEIVLEITVAQYKKLKKGGSL